MKHIYIALLLLVFISCSNDDGNESGSVGLQGEWNLVNVTGGFAGIDQDFDRGTIIWDFNESDKMVTVTNTSTITGVYDGFPSGTYPYAIVAPVNALDELVVNEINLGTFMVTSNSFTVSEQIRDGFQVRFER